MHPSPEIRNLLERFEKERRSLLWCRFLLTLASILAGGLVAGACADFCFPGFEELRGWGLYCILGTAVAGSWMRAGRSLFAAPDAAELARMIEHAAPSLEGRLLSLVELEWSHRQPNRSSAEFVSLLEQDVERRVRLFPKKLLSEESLLNREKRTLLLLSLPLVVALLSQTGRLHLARIALPLGELDGLSHARIVLTAPSPPEGFVPAREQLTFESLVTAHGSHAPRLEVRRVGSPPETIPMVDSGSDRFAAVVDSGQSEFQYRIVAGDTSTRPRRLKPVARPTAVVTRKELEFPPYTGRPNAVESDGTGNIHALVGTRVSLHIETSEPVQGGSLRMLAPELRAGSGVPLEAASSNPQRFLARLTVGTHGSFSIQIRSARTGLDSIPHPLHHIRAETDQPPRLVLESPAAESVLRAGEPLQIRAHIEDDFSGLRVSRWICADGQRWTETPLATGASSPVTISSSLSFAEAMRIVEASGNPAAGNSPEFLVKISATDSAGQTTESAPSKIRIKSDRSPAVVPDSLAVEKGLEPLFDAVGRGLENAARAAEPTLTAGLNPVPAAGKDASKIKPAQEWIRETEAAVERLQRQLHGMIREAGSDNADAYGMTLALNRIRYEHLRPARAAANGADAAASVKAADRLFMRARELFKAVLSSHLMDSIAEQTSPGGREGLEARGGSVTGPGTPEEPAFLGNWEHLKKLSPRAGKTADNALRRLGEGGLSEEERAESAQEWERESGPLREDLDIDLRRARTALREVLGTAASLVEAAGHSADASTDAAEGMARLEQTAETLRADARAHAARTDGASWFEQTLHQAARALPVWGSGSPAVAASGHAAARVAAALRPLEMFARLEEAADATARMLRDAKTAGAPDKETTAAEWTGAAAERLREELGDLPAGLESTGYPDEAVQRVREAGKAGEANDAGGARAALREALKLGADIARKFREELSALTPPLSVELARLAGKARAGAVETGSMLEEAALGDSLQKAADKERQFAGQVEFMRETLRGHANAQNILTQHGRDAARDADAAEALLRPAAGAAEAMEQAVQNPGQSRRLMESALARQEKTAETLARLAEHFKQLDSGSKEAVDASREQMRASEKESGIAADLDRREREGERLESLAKQLESPGDPAGGGASAEAREPGTPSAAVSKPAADAPAPTAAPLPAPDPSNAPSPGAGDTPGTPRTPGADSSETAKRSAVSQALDKAESAVRARSANAPEAVEKAMEEKKQADRHARSDQSPGGSPGSSEGAEQSPAEGTLALPALPRGAASGENGSWARLPRRLADEMRRGQEERVQGEYREAIESYFRSLSEKARK